MIGIKLFRDNPEIIKASQRRRNVPTEVVDDVINYDKLWRQTLQENDKLKHKRNVVAEEIAKQKREKVDIASKVAEMKELSAEIKANDERINEYLEKRDALRLTIGNILHESVPLGEDDTGNVEIKRWGEQPRFDFEPQSHLDIAASLGVLDAERGAKVAGAGFYYFKEELALLDLALIQYTVDFMRLRGYVLIEPPLMIRRKPYEGVTDLADFESVMYKIEQEDLYLIATSEHPMAAMFMDETLNSDELPLKFVGLSPCFRREIGAHGKYTRGLFRMHQFNKIEQFVFCMPEDSWGYHDELQRNAEELYQGLGIPYRVVDVCTGEIGKIAAKKYDIEIWMADGKYREAGSNSNCLAYQARRLNIKYDDKGERDYVHTLNNTAIATSRVMLAIIENYQNEDGSVTVPQVLQKYMGLKRIG